MTPEKEQAYEAFEAGRKLDEHAAQLIENRLQNDPANLDDRLALVSYLTRLHFQGDNVDEVRRKRAEHIFWLMDHVPDHPALGEPECTVLSGMDPYYDRYKQLWSVQVERQPLNAMVFGNAGLGVLVEDGELAEKRLLEAERLAPDEPEWPHMLSVVYELRAKYTKNRIDKRRWNKLSAEAMDRCKDLRKKRNERHSQHRIAINDCMDVADPEFWKNIGRQTLKSLMVGAEESRQIGSVYEYIGTGNVLVGLVLEKAGLSGKALTGAGIAKDNVREAFKAIHETVTPPPERLTFSNRCKSSLQFAVKLAKEYNSRQVEPEHLLLAILEHEDGEAFRMLMQLKVDRNKLRSQTERLIERQQQ